ncbi:FAD dependent oxidoreductase [Cladochytrium replicatum]|nr:FAD dependent oxidoreductase [Cladochytrium replicatum]
MPLNKIVVVGAGTFGLSTALAILDRARKDDSPEICVLDRYPVPTPDAASSDINKIVRPDYGSDELYTRLALRAIPIWQAWSDDARSRDLSPPHQPHPTLSSPGKLFTPSTAVFFSSEPLDQPSSFHSETIATLRRLAPNSKDPIAILDPLPEWAKNFPPKFRNAYASTLAGWADSAFANAYVATILRERGVKFFTGPEGTFKRLVVDEQNEKVLGVETLDGSVYEASQVVIAAGSWTPAVVPETKEFMVATGQPVVQFDIPDEWRSFYSSENFPVWLTADTGFYGFPLHPYTNRLKIANHGTGFLEPHTVPPTSSFPLSALITFRHFIHTHLPHLSTLSIALAKICYYTDTNTGDFLIAPHPRYLNCVLATGGSGHGFKFMPVLGDIVVDVMEGKDVDPRFGWRQAGSGKGPKQDMLRPKNEKEKVLKDEVFATQEQMTAEWWKEYLEQSPSA